MTPRHTTPAPVAHGGGGGRVRGAGTHTPSRRERVVSMIRNITVDGEEALAVDTAEELGRGHCQLGLLLAELPHAQLPRIPVSP